MNHPDPGHEFEDSRGDGTRTWRRVRKAVREKRKRQNRTALKRDLEERKADELRNMVNTEFPHLMRMVTIYCGDANDKLAQTINDVDWQYNRGLLFLDPYATQVNWTTLVNVSRTQSIDVWYLFPFSALERMLPKNGKYDRWEDCIDRLLGDPGWQTEFYRKDPQLTLFDIFPDETTINRGERLVKDADPEHVKDYN